MIKHVLLLPAISIILFGFADGHTWIVGQNESIQAAIEAASRGDIIVANGETFHENLNLDKLLILQGVGMPVIDAGGNGSAITISASGTVLQGFLVRNSSKLIHDDGGIKIISNDNIILNNIVENCGSGISLHNSSNNTIEANSIRDNEAGINLSNSYSNKVTNNEAHNNNYGIFIHKDRNSTVAGNNVTHNNCAILLDKSSHNTITNNSLSFSKNYGIHLLYSYSNAFIRNKVNNNGVGISVEDSNNNTFTDSIVCYNKMKGIDIQRSYFNDIVRDSATYDGYGISLYDSGDNIVKDNIVGYNKNAGIQIYNSTNNTFIDNDARNNMKNGIELFKGARNEIINNKANNNSNGIYIEDSRLSTVTNNQADYNKEIGIYLNKFINSTIRGNNAGKNRIGIFLLESYNNIVLSNKASTNKDNGVFLESSANDTIVDNIANNNLGGILLLNSVSSYFKNNSASNNSGGIALQNSSYNEILNNNAGYNKIGIYLNRSNSNHIVENILVKNEIAIAINLSKNDNLSNYFVSNRYNILTNQNDTIPNRGIWRDSVLAEHTERYLRLYQKNLDNGHPETGPIRPRFYSADRSPKFLIQIKSNPQGAEIQLDGRPYGKLTPCNVELTHGGKHSVDLYLSGYEPYTQELYLTHPEIIDAKLRPIEISKTQQNVSDVHITINSSPRGASIWVDKNFTGKSTPSKIYFNSNGNHTYELFLSGYEYYQGDLNLEQENINITLTPKKSEASSQTDNANKRSSLPDFLAWQPFTAIILVYYFFSRKKCRIY